MRKRIGMDPKRMTLLAKKCLRSEKVPFSGTAVSLHKESNVQMSLGELCWTVCVCQHHRRVEGRKEGRRRRGQEPNPA